MRIAKYFFGSVTGMVLGTTGLVVGLWCSWLGFSSQPYTSAELGSYLGTMGMFGGLTLGVAAVAWRFQNKSLAKRHNEPIA